MWPCVASYTDIYQSIFILNDNNNISVKMSKWNGVGQVRIRAVCVYM